MSKNSIIKLWNTSQKQKLQIQGQLNQNPFTFTNSFHEWSVLMVFVLMIFLYFFHDPQYMTGWSKLLSINNIKPKPATAAIFCTLLLFVIPANPFSPYPSGALLDWKTVQTKLEWGVIILRGGGFSMADAVTVCLTPQNTNKTIIKTKN